MKTMICIIIYLKSIFGEIKKLFPFEREELRKFI